ncbi:P-loop containing nucleoside triphosphate hydrolase protein [Podospora australis]|uniref:P-loop containing nucleoside triphosphate hydrolase protein n=1 Tax=Podospora australis TaxID=1536484 RepID=A0AAN6WNE8_9PEZI|nr:P-loop containing nucleoside triphosphate hydrolase protein [Podospora australis]
MKTDVDEGKRDCSWSVKASCGADNPDFRLQAEKRPADVPSPQIKWKEGEKVTVRSKQTGAVYLRQYPSPRTYHQFNLRFSGSFLKLEFALGGSLILCLTVDCVIAATELKRVCYGMLQGIPVTSTETAIVIDNTPLVRACFREDGLVERYSDGTHVRKLDKIASDCFSRLIHQENVYVQLMLHLSSQQASRSKGPRRVAYASAILYGPEEASDCVGTFLDECKFFLQDPFGCEENVPYKNPHCLLSVLEEPRMTFDLPQSCSAVCVTFTSVSESLMALETTEEFPESTQPVSLRPNVQLQNPSTGTDRYRGTASASTLVVVPLSLMSVWEEQLERLAALSRLLRFLRFRPYDGVKALDNDIFECFRPPKKDVEEGTRRLQALCRPIMIRRSNKVITLPIREDRVKMIPFSPQEKSEYTKLETSLHNISDGSEHTQSETANWNIVTLLSRLRIFCNLGLTLPLPELPQETGLTLDGSCSESDGMAEAVISSQLLLGAISCAQCQQIIDASDTVLVPGKRPQAYYSKCQQLISCTPCASLCSYQATSDCKCVNGAGRCKLRVILSQPGLSVEEYETSPSQAKWSGKARAIVQEVKKALPEKSVIFSFWRTSLLMIQQALELEQVRCERIDGKLSASEREAALKRFKTDDGIKVILVTILCGGVGLDLTTASRIHLCKPQWNPAAEEQALARVHRLGQQRPVVTIRYVMSNSIEEHVASVKGRKQLLANLLPGSSQCNDQREKPSLLVLETPFSLLRTPITSGYGSDQSNIL